MKKSSTAGQTLKPGGEAPSRHGWSSGRSALVAAFIGLLVLLVACGDNAPRPGNLEVHIGGLPSGVDAAVAVSGPAAYSMQLTASTTLSQLQPGDYQLVATNVDTVSGPFAATVTGSPAAVVAGSTAVAEVSYELVGAKVAEMETIVPFAYGAGRDLDVQVVRTGGYQGPVTVTLDGPLPSGVTLSSSVLAYPAGESSKRVTFVADGTVAAENLDEPVELAVTVSAGGATTATTLSVRVSALVMNTDDSGPGSLRQVLADADHGRADSFATIGFDPVVFAAGGNIQLATGVDLRHYQHIEGPVDANGAPLVKISAAGADNLIGLKDSVEARLSNLLLEGVRGGQNGGAIHSQGRLEVDNLVIMDNQATFGGGIYALMGELIVRNSVFSNNLALGTGDGGAIYNRGATVEVSGSLFEANGSPDNGGAIFNETLVLAGVEHRGQLTIQNSGFKANLARYGGAIRNGDDAVLTVIGSSFAENVAAVADGVAEGGAISNQGSARVQDSTFSDNGAFSGGAVNNSLTGTMRISGSTFVGNQVTTNGGAVFSNGLLHVTNSTFVDNAAQRGAALFVSSNAASVAHVAFSTISGNRARVSRGSGLAQGGGISVSGTLHLRGTIVHGNQLATAGSGGPDIHQATGGTVHSEGHNLIGDIVDSGMLCAPDLDICGQDPQLGVLQDNGGPTRTLAITAASPAADKVPAANCLGAAGDPLATDQRGQPRPGGVACDIGAFEAP